jgi:transposase-like protein
MEIIRECEESGLSNREFCSQRGISEKTYYYWLRKVRAAAATVIEPQLVRVDNPTMSGTEQLIEIRYGRAELKLPEDVDLKALAAFLNTLRRHD